MTRVLLSILLVFAVTVPSATALAARSAESEAARISRAASQTRRALDLQLEFPEEYIPAAPSPPPDMRPLAPEIAQLIMYVGIAILVVVLVMALKDNLWSHSRSRRLEVGEDEADDGEAAVGKLREAGSEADSLASGGSYREAMHTLLLQTLAELRRRLEISMAVSLTSREILAKVALPQEHKDLFRDIISRVEVCYFGPHEPDAADYSACRRSYEQLCRALAAGGGR